ncbi:MAG TPA: hypothetical protein VJ749_05350 [Pyrinomonadaceae bacterium]|nr:hypothetical protein [Pyrinomonadaceae bacterium]
MKLLLSIIYSLILATCVTVLPAVTAVSQTTTPKPDPPKADDATRIGLVTPRVNLLGGGGSVLQETNALRQSLSSFLTGPRIGTIDVRAKLDSLALEEAKERFCDYVLYVSLTRKRQSTPNSGGSYGSGTKAGDEFTFTFKIVSVNGGQSPVERVLKGTASADGQDVLTPMVETAAQVVVELAKVAKPARPERPTTEATVTANETTKPQPAAAPTTFDKPPTGYGTLTATPKGASSNRTNDPPKQEGTIRIGLVTPRVNTVGSGMGGQSESASLRSSLSSFLAGSNIETIDLKARLDSLALTEAQHRECDFVLYTTLLRKRSSSSTGNNPLNSIVGNVGAGGGGKKVPGTKTASEITTQAARVSGAIASIAKANDEITFEYKLVTSVGARPVATKSTKAKVKSDGEDVLTPMIESAAQAILDATVKN